ncbi:MAG: YiiX/YebB-like N1pC/P60 family cysteine hydrolase [Verrucomicrobiales bacterium]
MESNRLRDEVDETILALRPLIEISQASQEEIRRFRQSYLDLGEGAPLPPKSLREMRDGRRRYLNLLKRLAAIARRFVPLIDSPDTEPVLRHHGIGLSLAAAVTLYDDYLSLLTLLRDDRLRQLLNHPDYGYGIDEGVVWQIVEGLHSKQAQVVLGGLLEAWEIGEERGAPADKTSVLIRRAIQSSISFRYAQDAVLQEHLPTGWTIRRTKFLDSLEALGEDTVGAISKAFGNGIGLVEMRKGKLWDDDEVRRQVLANLRPLDLLLEKTPFRLTDFFIPGHFGHVAIWTGLAGELDDLGLWNLPGMGDAPMVQCREAIDGGRCVLEALRTGVELNRLEDFLNVDDLAILRPLKMDEQAARESLRLGLQQVGKEYDFNFDVETSGTIVCSELPYHVYPGVDWATESQLGRFTINPDHIAAQALSTTGAFELVLFYRDGQLVDRGEAPARLRELVQA